MSSIFAISDLHIQKQKMTIFEDCYQEVTSQFFSRLITEEDLLLICGDLMDKGGANDTEEVVKNSKEVLEFFCSLNCSVMFIPGNHDIADDLAKNDMGSKYDRINDLLNECRRNYGKLIPSEINSNRIVTSTYVFDQKILVIGLNSTCKIGLDHESGYIDLDALKQELTEIQNNCKNYKKLCKVAVIHHNCYPVGENSTDIDLNNRESINGNIKNATDLRQVLESFEINVVISGHTHGNQTVGLKNYISDKSRKYITVDSLAETGRDSISMSEFKISDSGVFQSQIIYAFTKVGPMSKWDRLKELSLIENGESPFDCSPKEVLSDNEQNISLDDDQNDNDTIGKVASDAITYLKDRIREKRLLKTGHFCNNDDCTLTWIDTTSFISDVYKLDKICEFFEIIFHNEILKADVIIGLGMKGTIIANALRVYSRKNVVVYYPDDDDDNQFNKTNFFEKELGKCKSILILTDVYSTGNTIKRFYKKHRTSLQNKEVQVLCVFNRSKTHALYGEGSLDSHLVSVSADTLYETYRLWSLCNIPSISCENSRDDCVIYKDSLCEISH